MKTVFESSMVAHLWANQSQDRAKSGHGNFFFDGPNLYSYGSHYLVGRIMPDGAALLNGDSHSRTTANHKHFAAQAASHLTRYTLPGLTKLAAMLPRPETDMKRYSKGGAVYVRGYCLTHALELPDGAGEYLLLITGEKKPISLMVGLRKEATRRAEKKKASEEAATKKGRLEYGAKVAALAKDEKALIAGLANIIGNGKTEQEAVKLHYAHRALKAAKRNNQAADCYRVLQIVRAEIALRKRQVERKDANQALRRAAGHFRECVAAMNAALKAGTVISSGRAYTLQTSCEALVANDRVPAAIKPALRIVYSGMEDVKEAIREAEDAHEAAEEAERLAAWRRGDTGARAPYNGGTMLRAIGVTRDASGAITGGTLQTSKGAEVPLLHAIRAFRFLKLCRDRAVPRGEGDFPVDVIAWERNGHSVRVGHFAIDTIWASGNFRAGCHKVDWAETEALAQSLGVFSEAASDAALEASHAAA